MEHAHIQDCLVPALGLGTWRLKGAGCRQAVGTALELGYRHLDTAEIFDNEEEIGVAIRESNVPRGEMWISSKLWHQSLHYEGVWQACLASLDRLGTDYFDLLMIHWPSTEVPLTETLRGLRAVQEEGLATAIGVSNFPPTLLRQALEFAPLLATQMEYHPYLQPDPILRIARAAELLVIAYCPLARGLVSRDSTLAEIGAKYGKSPAQVALRWLLQKPNVAVIPKAAKRQHLRENIEVFDFLLADNDVQTIDDLHRRTGKRLIDPSFAPAWDL